jgi:hypothetical protein
VEKEIVRDEFVEINEIVAEISDESLGLVLLAGRQDLQPGAFAVEPVQGVDLNQEGRHLYGVFGLGAVRSEDGGESSRETKNHKPDK